jgi:subtilase family serine protease
MAIWTLPLVSGRLLRPAIWITAVSLVAASAVAQRSSARITKSIDNSERAPISGSHSPMARASNDVGRVPSGGMLQGMSIVFRRSAAQEAALRGLVAAQQNPASILYHHWLTPLEFADRFGMAEADIEKLESWLEQQGFSLEGVSHSKNRITFSGTVGQAEAAFGFELHYYKADGKTHYAPSTDLSIPAALSSVVETVTNLSSFRPRGYVKSKPPQLASKPDFTSGQSQDHFLTPGDVATIYDIKAAYTAGYTGDGQSIAVVGQSYIEVSDIENFQNAAGLTVKDPTLVLVPNSGTAAVSTSDEAESDIDLEYSGGIATGATIYLVYVGNNANYSVWDSISYAVDTQIAPIISASYGSCETELGTSGYSSLNAIMEQAAAQGQTVIAAAGDDGSTSCSGYTDLTTSQQEALSVNFPASSEYVTGLGGTEFPTADVASSNTTYWEPAVGGDLISSALSYIPEQVWNDDSTTYGISSGGGGVSTQTSRPSWQTGVTGIPSGNFRLVPDISLDSSPENAGYLYCSSDTSFTDISGSCANGFRDTSDTTLTVAGGTSFAAPMFAGMMALINQKLNSTGEGVVNSTLYTLAANSTTYATAFHDIVNGSNKCTAGSTYCSTAGESAYAATTGYDEASGLGSVDLYNLLTSWPTTSASSLDASTTILTAATATPASAANDIVTITVASGSTSSVITTTPTGTLTIAVDGTTESSSLALSSGTASYTFSSTTNGSHVITAAYSGDSNYAASKGAVWVSVGGTTVPSSGTFTLAATNTTAAQGASGTSTVTVTSKNSYAGTMSFTLSTESASLQNYGCYVASNATVAANGTATTTVTLYTSESACNATSSVRNGTRHNFVKSSRKASASRQQNPAARAIVPIGAAAALAEFLLFGLRRRRSTLRTRLSCLLLLGILAVSVGCGGGSSSPASTTSSTATDVAQGTYTLTLDGADTLNSSISAETTFNLTVD